MQLAPKMGPNGYENHIKFFIWTLLKNIAWQIYARKKIFLMSLEWLATSAVKIRLIAD